MEKLATFLLLPPVQGLLGGTLVILIKMLVDWFTKGYFARKRTELRSYDTLYDSISLCEARYSILWKSETFDLFKGKLWTKADHRARNEELLTVVIDELIKMNHCFKWLDDKGLQTRIEKWESNIQRRIERTRKQIEEEPISEDDDKAVRENPYEEILNYLQQRIRKLARYNY